MNLKNISDMYQKNLVEFFSNEKVIDFIYEEQYGKENYAQNKEKCKKEYKDILDNTIFVPYITIEHLETLINSAKSKYGIKYVENNLKAENNLLSKLSIKRDAIITDGFSSLFKELHELNPKLDNIDLTKTLYEDDSINRTSNKINNVDSIIANLEKILDENKQNLHPIKNRKISQLLAKYKADIKDKILIETSSYFKHKSDVAENLKYVPIIENLTRGGQRVEEHLDKDPQKIFRYIYLPILKYRSKQDYLKDAVHEVMHISKEKINGRKYKSGLLNSLTVKEHPVRSFIQSIRWSKLKKNFSKNTNVKFPDEIEKYQSYSGEIAIDEVVHHWQVRNVVKNILNSNIIEKFKMPYINENNINEITSYEFADDTTKKFMDSFENDMKEINNGNLSVRSFKHKVGVSSYDSLSHLFDIWTSTKQKTVPLQSTLDTPLPYYKVHKIYSEMGSVIVNQMNINASKTRKNNILKRTMNVTANKICEIGSFLDRSIEHSTLTAESMNSSKKQTENDELER